MKRFSKYLKKSSLTMVLALLVGLVGKFSMNYFSQAVNMYTKSLIISYTRQVMDQGVTEGVVELLDGKSIIHEVYDTNGKVSYAYLDAKTVNYIRNNISKYITECINKINQGESFHSVELPLGFFFSRNYFLSNGVKVPIALEVIGHQDIQIEKQVESYGLNTTIFQLNLKVILNIRSVIPFQTDIIESECSIPLALEILNNDIPYYLGDFIKK